MNEDLVLTLRAADNLPIDMTGVLPEPLLGMDEQKVTKVPIRRGNRLLPLADLFSIEFIRSDFPPRLRIVESGPMLANVGAGMAGGILVAEDVGFCAGARMTGGQLIVRNAGDWLGAEMAGGSILASKTGSQAGAAFRGSRHGMRGGSILIHGDAGDETGLRMRRGSIQINGNCGDFAAAAMIAGTLDIRGRTGKHTGAGMKRGTVIVRSGCESLSPGFTFACSASTVFQRMSGLIGDVHIYRGDLAAAGLGEIWIPAEF